MSKRQTEKSNQATTQASSDEGQKPSPVRLPLWKKIAFSLIAMVLILAMFEGTLAILGIDPVLYDEDPYVGFSSIIPLFVEDDAVDGQTMMVTNENKLGFFNHQQFAKQKPENTFRIVCLGGSTTYGRPYDERTSFGSWLQKFLTAADPSKNWEVINAGGISYASYRVAVVMEEMVQYDVDLFIIYSGHNEFLEQRTYADVIKIPVAIRGMGAIASHSRIYTVFRNLFSDKDKKQKIIQSQQTLESEVVTRLDNTIGPTDYTRDDNNASQIIDHFHANLIRLLNMADTHDAKVMFITPAANLRHCTPFKSQHRAGLSADEKKRWDELYEKAKQAFAIKNYIKANRFAEQAIIIDPRYAHLLYLQGQILDQLKQFDKAKAAYIQAGEEDVCPLRALSQIQQIVRTVCEEFEVPLVDFAKWTQEQSPQNIPGKKWFLDHVHPTIDGHRELALSILNTMQAEGWLTKQDRFDEAAIQKITKQLKSNIDQNKQAVALRNLANVLKWAGKFDDSRRIAQRSLKLNAKDPETYFIIGICFSSQNKYDEAIVYYEKALPLARNRFELYRIHHNLASCYSRLLRFEPAIDHYRKAVRLAVTQGDKQTERSGLASILSDYAGKLYSKDKNKALMLSVEALKNQPNNAEILTNHARILQLEGDAEKAKYYYHQALTINPNLKRAINGFQAADRQLRAAKNPKQ